MFTILLVELLICLRKVKVVVHKILMRIYFFFFLPGNEIKHTSNNQIHIKNKGTISVSTYL